MSALVIIPARAGSKGVPGKNLKRLEGQTLVARALACAQLALPDARIVVSTDIPGLAWEPWRLDRPAELAADDTPMIDVVRHVLDTIPGPPDQPIVLLQPTQPFRTPEHVFKALALLAPGVPGVDSVVSVVPLPLSHSPELVFSLGRLVGGSYRLDPYLPRTWSRRPTRRQDAHPAFRPDGTVYAFWRRTVTLYGNIYGTDVAPLLIPADESCELDTAEDWADVQRRWSSASVRRHR